MKTESQVDYATLKQLVSMAQILDHYQLRDRFHQTGSTLSGPCPLHGGHNPTQFRISLSANCWHCFGDCRAGGSILDFVSRMEGVRLPEAARLIQGKR